MTKTSLTVAMAMMISVTGCLGAASQLDAGAGPPSDAASEPVPSGIFKLRLNGAPSMSEMPCTYTPLLNEPYVYSDRFVFSESDDGWGIQPVAQPVSGSVQRGSPQLLQITDGPWSFVGVVTWGEGEGHLDYVYVNGPSCHWEGTGDVISAD